MHLNHKLYLLQLQGEEISQRINIEGKELILGQERTISIVSEGAVPRESDVHSNIIARIFKNSLRNMKMQ